jgi:hypothetical protein
VAVEDRRAARQDRVVPLVAELADWMRTERGRLSRHAETAKAIDYMLKRWTAFTRFLDDGRICLTNNAAERALRGIALGRKTWLFAGSDRGGERAATIYTLIGTAKLNDVDPQAWLADVLGRINDHPASRLDELPPGTGTTPPLKPLLPEPTAPRPWPDAYIAAATAPQQHRRGRGNDRGSAARSLRYHASRTETTIGHFKAIIGRMKTDGKLDQNSFSATLVMPSTRWS